MEGGGSDDGRVCKLTREGNMAGVLACRDRRAGIRLRVRRPMDAEAECLLERRIQSIKYGRQDSEHNDDTGRLSLHKVFLKLTFEHTLRLKWSIKR